MLNRNMRPFRGPKLQNVSDFEFDLHGPSVISERAVGIHVCDYTY